MGKWVCLVRLIGYFIILIGMIVFYLCFLIMVVFKVIVRRYLVLKSGLMGLSFRWVYFDCVNDGMV